jgi:hypothetical protein
MSDPKQPHSSADWLLAIFHICIHVHGFVPLKAFNSTAAEHSS